MSIESLIPMVNRWLEGVHSAMANNSASQDDSSEDEIEDEEAEEEFSLSIVPQAGRTTSTSAPCSGHDQGSRKKLFKSRFFKSAHEEKYKYTDLNDNVKGNQRDLQPQISTKRSLSSEDLPRNFDSYPGNSIDMEFEQESQEENYVSYHSRMKRESFDSTAAQRPFSPCSTLHASDQFSLYEEDIVLLSPQIRGFSSQRRASDGMVQRYPTQWTMQETTQGFSSSSNDINRTCSRASSRPATPASPFIKIKASGGFKLPPLNKPKERRAKLQELPSITVSDNASGSGSRDSLDSIPDEQPSAIPKHLEQAYWNAREAKSVLAVKNAKHLLQKRRGSLPTVLSAMRHSALPMVKEEHPQFDEAKKKPPSPDRPVNLQIPRHRVRSKSLDGQVGTASEWEQYKARAMERRAQHS